MTDGITGDASMVTYVISADNVSSYKSYILLIRTFLQCFCYKENYMQIFLAPQKKHILKFDDADYMQHVLKKTKFVHGPTNNYIFTSTSFMFELRLKYSVLFFLLNMLSNLTY